MKPLLILSILFFTSCGHNSSEQTSEVLLHDTLLPVSNSKFKEFECGTFELLKTQMIESGLRNPDNFKEFSFITSKNNLFSLLSIAKRDSLIISSFSTKQVKDFYIPTSKDSIWLTLPFKQSYYIKKGQWDAELKEYAQRLSKTKHYKVILNNVKFKLILRMFSLVKRGEMFVENYKKAA